MYKGVLLFFVSGFCLAGSDFSPLCTTGGDAQGIYECSKLEVKKADGALNVSYRILIDKVRADYKVDPVQGEKLSEQIRRSQRAWINLRDANCSVESFVISPETQAFEVIKNLCVARESAQRKAYLDNLKF